MAKRRETDEGARDEPLVDGNGNEQAVVTDTPVTPQVDQAEAQIKELADEVKELKLNVGRLEAALQQRTAERDGALRERDEARQEVKRHQARIGALESKQQFRHGDDGMVSGGR